MYRYLLDFKKLISQRYYTRKVRKMCKRCGSDLKVNGKSQVTGNTILGNHVNFNGLRIYGNGRVKIGNYFHSGIECLFITSFHDYESDFIPYGYQYRHKNISIGDCVWLGNRVIYLGGICIGEGAIIQAGSVVVSDIPSCAIAGGAPARVFKYRNKEHFYKLKQEKRFH